MKKTYLMFALVLAVTVCRGGTIYWDIITWGLNPYGVPDMYLLDITAPDYNGVIFRTEVDAESSEQAILQNFRSGSLGCRLCTILQVTQGIPVDDGLVSNDITGWFYQVPNENTWATPDLEIPLTDSRDINTVLLAFVFETIDWINGSFDEWYNWYGWVEIGYDDARLYHDDDGDMEVARILMHALRDKVVPDTRAGIEELLREVPLVPGDDPIPYIFDDDPGGVAFDAAYADFRQFLADRSKKRRERKEAEQRLREAQQKNEPPPAEPTPEQPPPVIAGETEPPRPSDTPPQEGNLTPEPGQAGTALASRPQNRLLLCIGGGVLLCAVFFLLRKKRDFY